MKKKPRNLLDGQLTAGHSDLEEKLYGLGAVYGKIIFASRMEKGLTQRELAEKAGVGLKTVTRAEGGSDNLGTLTYENLFRALDLNTTAVAEMMYQLTHEYRDLESMTVMYI